MRICRKQKEIEQKTRSYFYEYYIETKGERSPKMANYMKFGTTDSKEMWMLKYGFDFEDMEWLKPYVEYFCEEEICFAGNVDELVASKKTVIEKFIY